MVDDDLERQIKELERDKRLEEIKQLRAAARTRWVTPAALAALLPLLAGFGVWVAGEMKQYSEGYRALAERDALRQEKEALQKQKDGLNIEVSTLLQLKAHYAEEAQRLQQETITRQDVIDKTYLRAVFTSNEVLYALSHITAIGPPPDRKKVDGAREEIARLSKESAATLRDALMRYELTDDLVASSRNFITEFQNTLKVVPASDWTRQLQSMPTGSVVSGKKIMISSKGDERRYYDVVAGRFLSAEEAAGAR